jgi:hypothetical protein
MQFKNLLKIDKIDKIDINKKRKRVEIIKLSQNINTPS